MKTSWTLALMAVFACSVVAQTPTNPPALPPPAPGTTPVVATPVAVAAPAAPAPVVPPKKAETPAPKPKAAPKKMELPPAKPAAPATPLVPGPATVNVATLNVRGQAKLTSDRVVQLKSGDTVTVLEEIVLDKPAADEPARWARIALPAEAKVWVNTLFIDATNKTVIPARLNLRAGPGENFSIVGLIEKGNQVREAGAVQGDWLQINAPTNSYAFVASEFLTQATPTVAAVTPPSAPVVPPPAPEPKVVPAPVATPVPEPTPIAPPVVTPPPPAPVVPMPETPVVAPMPEPEEPLPPRIVSHEGVVRTAWSVQAPTKYTLVDPDSGRTVNYLYSTSTNLDLGRYKGLRIVVTGEEGLDERWRNTPVLTIQRIQVLE